MSLSGAQVKRQQTSLNQTQRTLKLKLYTPHSAQLAFHQSTSRYRVAALGRQAGKSTMCLNELVRRAWEMPRSRYWFVSPTFAQAKIQYRRMVGMLMPCKQVMLKKNQSELRVKLINQSEVSFKSGESFDSLRGDTLNGAVIDEVRDQKEGLWKEVIRPMLTTTNGWAAFVSTPNGFDQFFEFSERCGNVKGWELFKAPSTCNPLFTQEEYENARMELGEAIFDQEINANFRDLHQGSAYVNYSANNELLFSPFLTGAKHYHPQLPIIVALDFNLAPSIALIGQIRHDQFYFFKEFYVERSHTQEMAKEVAKYILSLDIKATPHHVTLIGDATGKAGQRAAGGRSDFSVWEEILTMNGIKFLNITPDSNPEVRDRVNTVNSLLLTASGDQKIFINAEGCPRLKKDLQRVSWRKGFNHTLDQVTDKTLTHLSDAMGYAVCALTKIWSPKVGGLRVIRRG